MFKIDWATAIGGAAVGYLVKGKVEDTKSTFKGIYTGAIDTLKESFSSDEKDSQSTQGQSAPKSKTGKNG